MFAVKAHGHSGPIYICYLPLSPKYFPVIIHSIQLVTGRWVGPHTAALETLEAATPSSITFPDFVTHSLRLPGFGLNSPQVYNGMRLPAFHLWTKMQLIDNPIV